MWGLCKGLHFTPSGDLFFLSECVLHVHPLAVTSVIASWAGDLEKPNLGSWQANAVLLAFVLPWFYWCTFVFDR